MFSIWIFSLIVFFIAVILSKLFSSIIDEKYIQNFIYIIRICFLILLLLTTYFWFSKPYKKILGLVPDKTTNFMSLYLVISFLLLINNYPTSLLNFNNFNSIYEILLFLVFIILGYLLVFTGIASSSKIIILENNYKTIENQVELQHYIVNYDNLTGIANRANIMNQLNKIIEISKTNRQKFALLLFDLDGFKSINDKYGHLIGDKALTYVAQTIQNVLRKTDFVGRFGGDEFILIQQFIKDEGEIEILINRIFENLKTPLILDDKEILITISVGASIFTDYTSDLELLINRADNAMYEAKKREGCTFSLFKNPNIKPESNEIN
jgi:diguanylate cyclase (GGDEF)-like protein